MRNVDVAIRYRSCSRIFHSARIIRIFSVVTGCHDNRRIETFGRNFPPRSFRLVDCNSIYTLFWPPSSCVRLYFSVAVVAGDSRNPENVFDLMWRIKTAEPKGRTCRDSADEICTLCIAGCSCNRLSEGVPLCNEKVAKVGPNSRSF